MKKHAWLIQGIVLVLSLNSSPSRAQQVPVYSQYMFNMQALNPAYAGSRETLHATAVFRKQWLGVPGSPQTSAVALDMPANNNWLGLGLQLSDDVIGIQHTTSLSTSYAVRLRVASDQILAMGLQAGVNNFRADYNQVDLVNPYDPTFLGYTVNRFLPYFGAGIYYYSPDFYIGLSSPDLVRTTINDKVNMSQQAVSRFQNAHFFLAAGYVFSAGESVKVKPSVLVRAIAGVPPQVDLNTNVWFNDLISVGLSYRTRDAVVGMAEMQLSPGFRLGYAYEHTISGMGQFNKGTHELMLHFTFGDRANQSPRYF